MLFTLNSGLVIPKYRIPYYGSLPPEITDEKAKKAAHEAITKLRSVNDKTWFLFETGEMKYVFQKIKNPKNFITICDVSHMNETQIKSFFSN